MSRPLQGYTSEMIQSAILAAQPANARFVTFGVRAGADPAAVVLLLGAADHDPDTVLGVGLPLACAVAGLRAFPDHLTPFPSTQRALWVFLRHDDRTRLFDAGRRIAARFRGLLDVVDEVDSFTYRGGRDLSGFVDGTENPKGNDAVQAAIIDGRGGGLDGGSFVAVQRWVHDLEAIDRMTGAARAGTVGRDQESDVELPDAPASAHVKRTAQETFDPPAHILRRSMPYGGIREHGLNFVAFCESLDRFERQLRRMAGADDGVPDGILSFTRAVSGAYYFCPPLRQGRYDLRALGA